MSRFGRPDGAVALTFAVFMATNFTAALNFCAVSRFVWSFARDGGIPFSAFFARVEPRSGVPLNAVALTFACVSALSTPMLTDNWFLKLNARPRRRATNTPSPSRARAPAGGARPPLVRPSDAAQTPQALTGVASNGMLFVYALPPLLRVLNASLFTPSDNFNLGRLSVPVALAGAAYGLFSVATIALPNFYPVNAGDLNFAPIILGGLMLFVGLSFPVVGPLLGTFKGPTTAWIAELSPALGESIKAGRISDWALSS